MKLLITMTDIEGTWDAPYLSAHEYMGGFYVIRADSLDEAVACAERGRFVVGANEVRQVHEG